MDTRAPGDEVLIRYVPNPALPNNATHPAAAREAAVLGGGYLAQRRGGQHVHDAAAGAVMMIWVRGAKVLDTACREIVPSHETGSSRIL